MALMMHLLLASMFLLLDAAAAAHIGLLGDFTHSTFWLPEGLPAPVLAAVQSRLAPVQRWVGPDLLAL
eukprot:COSAG05_NODE_22162_length_266_cov_1.832335_1_plen_67_part_10